MYGYPQLYLRNNYGRKYQHLIIHQNDPRRIIGGERASSRETFASNIGNSTWYNKFRKS